MSSPALSKPAKLLGRQAPRLLTIPASAVSSKIDDALALWSLTGRTLDPWQETSLEALLCIDADGMWAASECGLLVSRQQGKGEILQAYDLAHLFLWPKPDGEPKVILHTAHEFATAQAHFTKVKRRILNTPWMRKQLKGGGVETARGISGISTGMGKLVFELKNGNTLVIGTRTGSAGVGLTVDVLVVDEAQEAPPETMEAVLFTQSGVANTQTLYTGTVPMDHQSGDHFEGVRDRGRAGTFPRTVWIEFSPDGSDDPDLAAAIKLDDRRVWAQSAPSLGRRTSEEMIEDEYNTFVLGRNPNPDAFVKQRLSIWPNPRPAEEESPNDLDLKVWGSADATVEDRVTVGAVLSVVLGRGGGYSSLGAGQRMADGRILVQHMDTRAGTLWVPDALKELRKLYRSPLIVLDERNCAPILSDLQRARIPFLAMNTNEVGAAQALFVELVNAGRVAHPDQAEVTIAMQNATTRRMGTSGLLTWEQANPMEPVTPLQAITFALWAVKKREAKPGTTATTLPAALSDTDDKTRWPGADTELPNLPVSLPPMHL